ncbi:STAS domain-containing protein [Streptomyces sp. NPDC003470]|uniref:STAS domain-containing protein n=1 Tax=Streptomyces sp. NPDC127100 TaxID=3347138 RepID=UPI00364BB15F
MSLDEAVARCSGGARGSRAQAPDQTVVVQYERCGARVVGARGSYDMYSVPPLADALDAAARECRRVVLDASGITFADSALVNLLVLTHHAADLRIAAPTQQVRRLLELTALDTVLKVRATVEEAAAC